MDYLIAVAVLIMISLGWAITARAVQSIESKRRKNDPETETDNEEQSQSSSNSWHEQKQLRSDAWTTKLEAADWTNFKDALDALIAREEFDGTYNPGYTNRIGKMVMRAASAGSYAIGSSWRTAQRQQRMRPILFALSEARSNFDTEDDDDGFGIGTLGSIESGVWELKRKLGDTSPEEGFEGLEEAELCARLDEIVASETIARFDELTNLDIESAASLAKQAIEHTYPIALEKQSLEPILIGMACARFYFVKHKESDPSQVDTTGYGESALRWILRSLTDLQKELREPQKYSLEDLCALRWPSRERIDFPAIVQENMLEIQRTAQHYGFSDITLDWVAEPIEWDEIEEPSIWQIPDQEAIDSPQARFTAVGKGHEEGCLSSVTFVLKFPIHIRVVDSSETSISQGAIKESESVIETEASSMVRYREIEDGSGCNITLDTRDQVIEVDLEMPFETERDAQADQKLCTTLLQAQSAEFMSAAALLMKVKQFDDGVYAAAELLAQQGTSTFLGKRRLLQAILSHLRDAADPVSSNLRIYMSVAGQLGGTPAESLDTALKLDVSREMDLFLADQFRSKPISFYDWTPELSAIFQQDRFLQSNIAAEGVSQLVEILRADRALAQAYVDVVDLATKMTNPLIAESLAQLLVSEETAVPLDPRGFLPSSRSPESELMEKLNCEGSMPDSFSLMEEIIKRLKRGTLTLTPAPNSGWYDYCLWALEPLVCLNTVAESKKRAVTDRYAGCLLELFKGAYCLTRETHAKQLVPKLGSAFKKHSISIQPPCTIEPLPSIYFRRAVSYKFIEDVLVSSFGSAELAEAHRLTSQGPVAIDLLSEIKRMQHIFYGAHLVSCDELSLPHSTHDYLHDIDNENARSVFLEWSKSVANCADTDVCQDARCMVPVFYDEKSQRMKAWVFLGWRKQKLALSYRHPPAVLKLDTGESDYNPEVKFRRTIVSAAYPVMAEVYVSQVMGRAEFTAHCDRFENESEIRKSLESV